MFHLDPDRKVIRIGAELPNGLRVDAEANIADELLVWKFKDMRICKEMYYAEKKSNKHKVKFFERLCSFAIEYPGKKKDEIEAEVKAKLEAQGLKDFTMDIVERTEKKIKDEYS